MSNESDSFSDISDLDVTEGTIANQVQQSQIDVSISRSILQASDNVQSPVQPEQGDLAASSKQSSKASKRRIRRGAQADSQLSPRTPTHSRKGIPDLSSFDPNTFRLHSEGSATPQRSFRGKHGLVEDRLASTQAAKEERLEEIRRRLEVLETEQCPFRPSLSRARPTLVRADAVILEPEWEATPVGWALPSPHDSRRP